MSVATPIVQTWDGANRRIYLKQGVADYFPIDDLYKEYRDARKLETAGIRKFNALLKAEGNVPKGAGAFTPRYVVLLEGTKIIPYDESLQLNQLGDMITDDPDVDPTLYDISLLTNPKPIFIKPSEAETIQLNSLSIEHSSYGGGVTIDVINGEPGIDGGAGTPLGTGLRPSNNEADTHAICLKNGFKKVFVRGDLLLDDLEIDWIGFEFVGESVIKTLITIDPDADVFNCEFYDCTVSGTLDGTSQIERAVVTALDFVDGYIFRCSIGPATISLGTTTTCNIFSCYSTVAGALTPTVDCNGTGVIALRDYNGGMKFINYSGSDAHSIDLARGQIILDSTSITGGTWVVRGIGKLVDENGVTIETGTWNTGVTIVNELVDPRKLQMMLDLLQGDVIPKATLFKILHRITKEELLVKTATVNLDGLTELTE